MSTKIHNDVVNIERMAEHRPSNSSGFTLMEVALAVSVVVIGLMALFALVSSGLDSSTRAVRDTQAAIFADGVYEGLRANSQLMAELGTNSLEDVVWRVFWKHFADNTTSLTIAADSTWDPDYSDQQYDGFHIEANIFNKPSRGTDGFFDPDPKQLRFDNASLQVGVAAGNAPLVSHALRYRLEVRPGEVIDWDKTVLVNTNVSVTLYVWPGEFGSTNDPIIFYSEFDNGGDL